jgi:hypothetical protein
MGKMPLSPQEIDRIKKLRMTGHSMSEIRRVVPRGKASILKYIKNVEVLPEYKEILKIKQGGSKNRANHYWGLAKIKARLLIPDLNTSSKMLILSCLYWGEGNKNELSLINSDPGLIKIFIDCLLEIGVKKDDLRVTLRLFDNLSKNKAIEYWSKALCLEKTAINNVNIITGNKKGKLMYGMCRVRVRKSHEYFKLVISMIDLLRFSFNAPVVQWIERCGPNALM